MKETKRGDTGLLLGFHVTVPAVSLKLESTFIAPKVRNTVPAPTPSNLKVLNALPGDAWSDAWLASAPGYDKLVLRMLKPEASADASRVERFLAGAMALSNLRHGAVVSVHSAGKTRDGKIFVLTDHVDGESLATRAQLPLDEVVDVGVPLADALGAAHS